MERPPSATTSKMSVTGRRDYGMKFIADMDDLAGSTINVGSHGQPPLNGSHESVKTYGGTPYWERHAEVTNTRHDEENDVDEGCHPFWTSWWDMIRGVGLIIAGMLKIPFTIGHGIAKALHFTPTLYNDTTVRKWFQITGFPSGIVAAVQVRVIITSPHP